jgi:excisionase family DNA binding protein
MAEEESMSVRDTAFVLGTGLQQVYRLLWEGKLSGRRVDGKWRITKASVQDRLDRKANTNKSSGRALISAECSEKEVVAHVG